MCDATSEDRLILERYLLNGVFGSAFALFGLIANGLLATLFLTRSNYRHSPFFFLGFVALFDTLFDATFILLLSIPVNAEYFDNYVLFLLWLNYMPILYLFSQIFKIASVFCLIMASIERYFMTKHWTFTGFERKTRWLSLLFVVGMAIIIKNITADVSIVEREECIGYKRFKITTRQSNAYHIDLFNTAAIFVPFFTLIFLNGGIVMMLRKQNVQQLRSLITELTMGTDVMKIRRRNLRAATNTLIVIISAYLISNLLNVFLTITEYLDEEFLHVQHPRFFQLAADFASVLAVVGNDIRCPAHFLSNSEIRQQFALMFFGEGEDKKVTNAPRKSSERLENPWISLLLTVHDKDQPNSPLLAGRTYSKRHSTIAIC
ncbi:unnamed protein product [Cylicocyclus nassatus]|uniref:G-protein coupled receptors family 1 profile domain-containing protein n=1 Tax=Cylicocyclus nassatus TaxID=53992 RepID=A0AA36GYT8_CYLNA|nr:unnamed protein product [Cylicocyclus nassatus]CAJ0600639.1 unnamed protein product [Cylicocyclus nassatus]